MQTWIFDRVHSADLRQIAAKKIGNHAVFLAVIFGRDQALRSVRFSAESFATRYRAFDGACFDVSCVDLEERFR
ncbi:hypothetical protein [Bradyrhizobium centrosematis]|uniref:hypothetical protein n=1 Tax=Bradyrhizobium centrosematis TaxID=1300039 RepID=UPI00388E7D2C